MLSVTQRLRLGSYQLVFYVGHPTDFELYRHKPIDFQTDGSLTSNWLEPMLEDMKHSCGSVQEAMRHMPRKVTDSEIERMLHNVQRSRSFENFGRNDEETKTLAC